MHRPMEPVPRLVPRSLSVQLVVEVVLGPSLDTALHGGRPLRAGIGGEGAQALPRVEGPSGRGRVLVVPTGPASLRVRGQNQPDERPAASAGDSGPASNTRAPPDAAVAVVGSD